MFVDFNLFRSTLHPENGSYIGPAYRWNLEMRFSASPKDNENWYNLEPNVRFAFDGSSYKELAQTVFTRRNEFLSYVRVAEDNHDLLRKSKLHFLTGLRGLVWFSNLLDTLGKVENCQMARE